MLRFEWRKIFSKKYYILFLLGIIILTNILFYFQNNQESINGHDYKQMQSILNKKTKEQRKSYLQELKDKNDLYMMKETFVNENGDLSKYLTTYGKTWVDTVIQMDYEEILDIKLINRLIEEESNLNSYNEFLQNVKTQYEINQSISIFNKNDDFIISRSEKTKSLYNEMKVTMPSSSRGSYGMEKLLSSFLPDIFLVIIIVYFFYVLVAFEEEKGILNYCSIMKKGNGKLLLSKWLALQLLIMMILAILFLTMYLIICLQYGACDLSQPIQSILYYVSVPYNLNIITFISLVYIYKILIYSALISLLFFIYACIKNYLLSVFTTVSIVGIFLMAALKIGNYHFLSYLNITQLLHPEYALKNTLYIRFFSEAIPYKVIYVFIVFITGLLLFLSIKMFCRKKRIYWYKKSKIKTHKLHSITFYEMKKLWIHDLGYLLILFFIGILITLILPVKSMSNTIDVQYNHYIDKIGNHVSKEADSKIEVEKNHFIEVDKQIKEEKDVFKLNELVKMQMMEEGFVQYNTRYNEIKKKDNKEALLKEDQIRFLVDNDILQSQLLFWFILLMILSVMLCYDRENYSRVAVFQNMLRRFSKKLDSTKFISIGVGVVSAILVMNSIMLIYNTYMYPNADYTKFLCESIIYKDTNFSFSIWKALLFQTLWQLIVSLLLVRVLQQLYQKIPYSKIITVILIIFNLSLLLKGTAFDYLSIFYSLFYPWKNMGVGLCLGSVLIILNIVIKLYERKRIK